MDPAVKRVLEEYRRKDMPVGIFMKSLREAVNSAGISIIDKSLGKAVAAGRGRHTGGRDLMTVLLRAYGFETRPLREYCTAEEIAGACSDPDVAVLCLSFQTTYDLPDLKTITGLLAERGIRDRIVLSAGGTAVSERIALEAGCDVFRMTALETAEAVEKEVRRRKSA